MFKIGDWVVCVEKSIYKDLDGEVGKIYQVVNTDSDCIRVANQVAKVGLSTHRFRLATPEDFLKNTDVPVKIKEASEKKQQLKKQLDIIRKKMDDLQKLHDSMQ